MLGGIAMKIKYFSENKVILTDGQGAFDSERTEWNYFFFSSVCGYKFCLYVQNVADDFSVLFKHKIQFRNIVFALPDLMRKIMFIATRHRKIPESTTINVFVMWMLFRMSVMVSLDTRRTSFWICLYNIQEHCKFTQFYPYIYIIMSDKTEE